MLESRISPEFAVSSTIQSPIMTTSLRRAITVFALGSVLFLSGCTKWAEKKNPNWRQATSGEHLVNLFWKDIQDKNWKQLEAHVAPEFAGVNSMQTMDRA